MPTPIPPQSVRAVVPPGQNVPAGHAAQVGGDVPVPGAVCSVPAAHEPMGMHMLAFGMVEYVPGPHGMQT
ncbi:MAG: hypothetical protein ABW252_12760 [Polyangiales bacterium]